MDITIKILLWIHLMALVGGGAAAVALPVVASRIVGAAPDTQSVLFGIGDRISMMARGALVVLLISGPLLFWLKWDFGAPSAAWFGIKMLLILVLLAGVIIAGINIKKAQRGDMAALKSAGLGIRVMGLALLGVVLAAVFAFN
jgi:uncharacterized membrane protein